MQVVTEILIDFSGSMKDKLPITKKILQEDIIPNLNYSTKIGVKTFFANKSKMAFIKPLLALSITNQEELKKSVEFTEKPDGNTPIAVAIRDSINTLKEYHAYDKKIILITDGEENCGGDYIKEITDAKEKGINCEIHIVGIGLAPEATIKAKNITNISQGSFSSINFSKGTTYKQDIIKNDLAPLYAGVTNVPDSNINFQANPLTSKIETDKSSKIPTEKSDDILLANETNSIEEIIAESKEELTYELIEDEKLNENIRSASEKFLFEFLNKKYPSRVKWLNENGESLKDHDFEIIDLDGSIEYYIECKGTLKNKSTFYLTKAEWRLFLNHTKNYQIYFIKNSCENPHYIFIDNLLDWLLKGKVVPYLKEIQVIKEERVFLTLME